MLRQSVLLAALMATVSSATTPDETMTMRSDLLGKFQSDWPVGDPRRCQEQSRASNFDIKRFEVLPGIGWDNLRNIESGVVVTYNFSQCKVTDDGNLLIPDNMYTVPLKSSSVESFAELYDHWNNPSSTTSNSINVEAGLGLSKFSISGKFSYEHEQLKSKQMKDNAVTTRVQLRYYRYEAKLQPDPELDPHFKSRLLSIAANVELNRTEQARYEGQLLVRDFGTHVLTSVTAGAGLIKDDYLKREYVESHSEDKSSILASASAAFFSVFKMGPSYSHKTGSGMDDTYNKMMTHSFIKTHGGPMFEAQNMTMNDWTKEVDRNLVPMDRSGDPLYFLVTPRMLPELPTITVSEVEKIVRESVELYYEMNLIPGCTKLGSPNFSFSANFDDGSCTGRPTNLTFGGVYQTCDVRGRYLSERNNPCNGLRQVNPKTGSYRCPQHYTPVVLHSATHGGHTENRRTCERCYIFSHCCHTDQYYSEALYKTYWCAATQAVPKESGYLFGGLYTSKTDNPVTGTAACPPNFYKLQLFTDLNICLGDDYELGEEYSIPFGGFFSCESGNPLASADSVRPVGSNGRLQAPAPNSLKAFFAANPGPKNWPTKCPQGYSQHMATTANGCAIHYCIITGALTSSTLPRIKRPPFVTKPPTLLEDEDNLVMFDNDAQTWKKIEKSSTVQQTLRAMPAVLRTSQPSAASDYMSLGSAVGISVGATLACVALATIVIVIIQRRRSRGKGVYRKLTQDETVEPRTTYGTDGQHNVVINEA